MARPGLPEDSDRITWSGLHRLNGRAVLILGITNLILGVALNVSANGASLGAWVGLGWLRGRIWNVVSAEHAWRCYLVALLGSDTAPTASQPRLLYIGYGQGWLALTPCLCCDT
jgi:hypothetical protein